MRIFKTLLLDLLLALAWFAATAMLAGIISANSRSGCVTCGAHVSLTIWWMGVLAMQPVIWAKRLSRTQRWVYWAFSVLAGVISYLTLEVIGYAIFESGSVSGGLSVGVFSNLAGVAVAAIASLFLVRRAEIAAIESRLVADLDIEDPTTGDANEAVTLVAGARPERLAHYPMWLAHLSSPKMRALYSPLPALVFILTVAMVQGVRVVTSQPDAVFGSFAVLSPLVYLFLTAIHMAIVEYIPWRERSKTFRLYCFSSVCWMIAVPLIAALFGLYGGSMDDDELLHMTTVAVGIPVLTGIAIYVYQRFVK